MIPVTSDLTNVIITPRLEDRSFRMNLNKPSIETTIVDGMDALKQRIFFILSTERHQHVILRNYGLKKNDIIGGSKEYAYAVLTGRIEEALLEDDCITGVSDFVYIPELSKGDNLHIRFRVQSVFGETEEEGDFIV